VNIINHDNSDPEVISRAKQLLENAEMIAASTDNYLHKLLRYDLNIINGITSVIKEHNITDLVLGLHEQQSLSRSFLGKLTEGILLKCNTTTFVYKPAQPLSTIKRHLVILPENAEKEIGFPDWLVKVWNIARNSGSKIIFYGNTKTLGILQEVHHKHPVGAEFKIFDNWEEFLILSREIRSDDNIILLMSRENRPSWNENMRNITHYLNKYFKDNSFILIYPLQIGIDDNEIMDLNNPSLVEPIEKLDEIGKTIGKLFRKRLK
jgi:hypothetical protein